MLYLPVLGPRLKSTLLIDYEMHASIIVRADSSLCFINIAIFQYASLTLVILCVACRCAQALAAESASESIASNACKQCGASFTDNSHFACSNCGSPNPKLINVRDVALLRMQLSSLLKQATNYEQHCNDSGHSHEHAHSHGIKESTHFGSALAVFFIGFCAILFPILMQRSKELHNAQS